MATVTLILVVVILMLVINLTADNKIREDLVKAWESRERKPSTNQRLEGLEGDLESLKADMAKVIEQLEALKPEPKAKPKPKPKAKPKAKPKGKNKAAPPAAGGADAPPPLVGPGGVAGPASPTGEGKGGGLSPNPPPKISKNVPGKAIPRTRVARGGAAEPDF